MKLYQIDVKVFTLKDILLDEMLLRLTAFVDMTLARDKRMLDFHENYQYKNYVLSGFKEFEKSKVYQEGKLYTFSVRTVDEQLKEYFTKHLKDTETTELKGLTTNTKYIPPMLLERVYTVTPAILKLDEQGFGYWKNHISIQEYEKMVFDNAVKKYKTYTGEDLDENFQLFYEIKFINRKPITTRYKNIHLLGDKIELILAENESAQKVAYGLLGMGILNNGARGMGFLNYKAV